MQLPASFLFFALSISSLSSLALAAPTPKNTFRPWKIGMGTNPARHMAVPESANFETIIGIAKPKGVKDLRENMSPPAGPEPEIQIPEVKKTDGKLKKDKDLMMENKARRMGTWNSGSECN